MSLSELLTKAVELYGENEAVVCGDDRFTYKAFGERIWRLCDSLLALGVRKGDRAAILHQNTHEYLETYFAAAYLGVVLVSLNYRLSPKELAMILDDCGARILISQSIFKQTVEKTIPLVPGIDTVIWTRSSDNELPSLRLKNLSYETLISSGKVIPPPDLDIRDEDVAHLYYTSGTTGRPKGVMLTQKNVKVHALGTIAELQLTDSDHWFHVAPLFHLADAWATFAITWVGGKHVLIPHFEPTKVLSVIDKERITLSNLIPTMLNMMINSPDLERFDYSSLRVILSGGAPIASETVRRIIDAFKCDYIQTYGMTETSPYLTMSILKKHLKTLPWAEQLRFKAKTGREFISIQLKVVDDKGEEVAKDDKQVGEIIVKGDTVTPGYWNLPEETKKAFRDGWLYTGDLAVIDKEGYVNILDRKKDMIITGGENVFSTEVENVLYKHPDILEVAVIGVPDEHWGEAVKACVVLKEGSKVSEQNIIDFCKEDLAGYKAPKIVEFLADLPKTGSGKIFKKGLKEGH